MNFLKKVKRTLGLLATCRVCGNECKNMVDKIRRQQIVKYCQKICRLRRHNSTI